MKKIMMMSVLVMQLVGCGAEIGSDAWCADLKEKPKGEWSMNEAGDYAKHCLLK